MGFLKRFLGRKGAGSPAQEPVVCPRLEHLAGYYGPEYWCDLGEQRVKIASLISSYRDIGPDHVERCCKGRYQDCPVYRGTMSG